MDLHNPVGKPSSLRARRGAWLKSPDAWGPLRHCSIFTESQERCRTTWPAAHRPKHRPRICFPLRRMTIAGDYTQRNRGAEVKSAEITCGRDQPANGCEEGPSFEDVPSARGPRDAGGHRRRMRTDPDDTGERLFTGEPDPLGPGPHLPHLTPNPRTLSTARWTLRGSRVVLGVLADFPRPAANVLEALSSMPDLGGLPFHRAATHPSPGWRPSPSREAAAMRR